jgi:hypothetical protein
MAFTLDGPPDTAEQTCSTCGATFLLIRHFILKDNNAYAMVKSELHMHDGKPEAWINAAFGSFIEDEYYDHVTFGSRVGLFTEDGELAASLVDAALTSSKSAEWGLLLTREQALEHHSLSAFWEVVDWLILEDPQVHPHLYGHVSEDPEK